jgi:hypothetical protein
LQKSQMTLAEQDRLAESKLPKWAQNELAKLRANAEHYKKEAWSATTPGVSNTFLETYGDSNNLGLPPDSHIGFRLGNNRLVCRITPEGLRVGNAILVSPAAANLVYIKVEDR